ncbi:MAG: ABC transporter ATP-binding protein [Oscillospiraceae bacterium]
MATFEIKNLVKKFGKTTALDGVSMVAQEGQIHAFLGPNGAGKTTTIRCLLSILNPTSGSITLFGQDAWKHSVELHKRLAYVPGDVNLWPNLTGGEVVDTFLAMRKSGPPNKARLAELTEQFEFDPSQKCGAYSKGNRQKVTLIAALAADVELYIFDEPTSGLDPLMAHVFEDAVADLRKKEKTVILSSHIMSEVEKLADSVSIIRKGKIIETGSMAEITKKADGKSLEDFFLSEYQDRG